MDLRWIVLCLVAFASCQREGENTLPSRSLRPKPIPSPPVHAFERIAFAAIDGDALVGSPVSPMNLFYSPSTQPMPCRNVPLEKCRELAQALPDSTEIGLVEEQVNDAWPPTDSGGEGGVRSVFNHQFVISASEQLDVSVPMLWSSTFYQDCGWPNPNVKPHLGSKDISVRTGWKGIPHRVMTVSHPMAALHVASRIVPQPATAGLSGAAQKLKVETIVFEESSGTNPIATFTGETTRFLADHSCGLPHAPATPFATLEDSGRLYVLFAQEELSDETIRFFALDVATSKVVYQWPGGLPNPKF